MPSIKAKKQVASEALKAERAQREEQYDAAIEWVNGLPHPAAKLLQLEKLRQTVSSDLANERNKIEIAVAEIYHEGNKEFATYMATGVAIPLAGFFIYFKTRDKHRNSFREKLLKEAQDYLTGMPVKKAYLEAMIDALVKDHVQEIIESPLRKEVLSEPSLLAKLVDKHLPVVAQLPLCRDIRDEPALLRKFAEVALRKGLSFEQAVTEENPVAKKEKFVPSWQKLADYNVITPRVPK